MPNLLFLAHRIPYPPNKGDKIRSYHLLRHLAERYRVFLGAFVDDPADRAHEAALGELCQAVYLPPLVPSRRKLASLRGLFTGQALTLPYYRHRGMEAWSRRVLANADIDQIVVYSSAMAQYALGPATKGIPCVVDFVDVDSEKWRQYGREQTWPLNWVYSREGVRLLRFEREVAAHVDASVFVSEAEAAVFRQRAPEISERVHWVENGVDTDQFSPDIGFASPYPDGQRVLVFTGAMDYWANADAVSWFAREVFVRIRVAVPDARFFIVGARPSETVTRLGDLPGVTVTGGVPDVRPYVAHAVAAVAPMRIARGIQNKVLEAFAIGKPVLATPAAMEGIRTDAPCRRFTSDDPEMLAEMAVDLLSGGDRERVGHAGRALVLRSYDWSRTLPAFDSLLGTGGSRQEPPATVAEGARSGAAVLRRVNP